MYIYKVMYVVMKSQTLPFIVGSRGHMSHIWVAFDFQV